MAKAILSKKDRYCIRCGSPNLINHAHTSAGTPRLECVECGKRSTKFRDRPLGSKLKTTAYAEQLKQLVKEKDAILVITAAQNATPIFEKFFKNLQAYCQYKKAHLVVCPYRYRNPTSLWSTHDEEDDWWDTSLTPYLLNEPLSINKNLQLMANINVQPTTMRPLSGLETMSQDKSAIVGHPKIELVSIPTPQNKLPKILTTTGALTVKNYTQTKTGKQGEFHHSFGATVVELKNGYFHLRQINADNNGNFIDLNKAFYDGKVKDAPRASALVMGDTHYEFLAPNVLEATFTNKDSMVNVLQPRNLVWHDSWDGFAISHHHRTNPYIRYAKAQNQLNNVQKSLDRFFAFVDSVTPKNTNNIFVASNHPEFLDRWLKETNPHDDATNAIFWLEASLAVYKGTKTIPQGTYIPSAFNWYGNKKLKCWKRTKFLERGQSFILHGIEMGYHGDKGSNGKPGTINAYAKIGIKNIVGHHHFVGIQHGAMCVGLSAYIDLDYTRGQLNAALHAHGVLYANGKRSLLIILPDSSW